MSCAAHNYGDGLEYQWSERYIMDPSTLQAYFDAVRSYDVDALRRLLGQFPELTGERWPGRGRQDGKMRSLGSEPYNNHTWLDAPVDPANPNDPRYTSTPLIYSRADAVVRLLVEYGADVNARGSSGDIELLDWHYTPLWRAAHDGRLDSVRLLVENGADVNYRNPDGTNQTLMTSIENGHLTVADFLLANGAIADIFTASMLGQHEEVSRLINEDPSLVHRRDSHGRTPLDAALLTDSFRVPWMQVEAHNIVAKTLIEHDAEVNPAHAAALGWYEWVLQRVEIDADLACWQRPFVPLLTGAALFETPLEAASRYDRKEIVELLERYQG